MVRQIHSSSLLPGYICQRSCAFRQYIKWLNIIIHIIFNLNKKCICDLLNTVEMHEASY